MNNFIRIETTDDDIVFINISHIVSVYKRNNKASIITITHEYRTDIDFDNFINILTTQLNHIAHRKEIINF